MKKDTINIGTVVDPLFKIEAPHVIAQSSALEPYRHIRALVADLAERLRLPLFHSSCVPTHTALLEAALYARHAFYTGPTGVGKTKLLTLTLTHLLHSGCSLLVIDPKVSTLLTYVALACDLGIPSKHIFLFAPSIPGAIPRFPLFAQPSLSPVELAAGFVDGIEKLSGSPGPRRHDLLINLSLLIICCGRDLSIDELLTALQDPHYRDHLLSLPPERVDPFVWAQVEKFIRNELNTWSKFELAEATSVCSRLFRDLLRSREFYGLTCARSTPAEGVLRIEDLWHHQKLVLVHLDPGQIGKQGSALLAGMLVRTIFAAAMRQTTPPRSVVLCLDELPRLAGMVGEELEQIVSLARSQHLKMILACQHASQLPPSLSETLQKQCAVQVRFREDFEEARSLAQRILAGVEPPITQVTIAPEHVDRETGDLSMTVTKHRVVDGYGRPYRISREHWAKYGKRYQITGLSLDMVLRMAGTTRLFVKEPGSGLPQEIRDYCTAIAPCAYWFEGPHLQLCLMHPRVRAVHLDQPPLANLIGQIAKKIATLPNRTALLLVDNQPRGIVRIAPVPDKPFTAKHQRYLSAALARNGQSEQEILATLEYRERQRQEWLHPQPLTQKGTETDDSRW